MSGVEIQNWLVQRIDRAPVLAGLVQGAYDSGF